MFLVIAAEIPGEFELITAGMAFGFLGWFFGSIVYWGVRTFRYAMEAG